MGLLGLLKKIKIREREIRIILIGLENAGKTSIVKSILNQQNSETSPTQGFEIHKYDYKDYHLDIWDVSGSASSRPSWHNFFDTADGVIYVVDASSKDKLNESVSEFTQNITQDRNDKSPWLIFVSKQDVPGCLTTQDVEAAFGVGNSNEKRVNFVGCSASTRDGIDEGLTWLIDTIYTEYSTQN